MSYSLETPCCNYPSRTPEGQGDCEKKDTCTDRIVLTEAISKIHQHSFSEGHQGYGTIILDCKNKTVAKEGDNDNVV